MSVNDPAGVATVTWALPRLMTVPTPVMLTTGAGAAIPVWRTA